ncbi:MAG: hypothetical protein VYE64_03880 [Planctomycetota bacterium]|nr:hypothetical protein [Planctomycetota bacterium]
MAKLRRTDDDQGAMDSLLDTMTNVVGILVIVLVVTQLGVGDAVQRIGEKLEVEPAELEQKKRELADLRAQQDRLKQEFQDLPPTKSEDVTDQLKRLQVDLDQKTLALKNLRQKNRQSADEMARQKKEQEEESKKRAQLEKELQSSLAEVASLRARLEETPERVVPPARELRLPNPRPAPKGAAAVTLICTDSRVYPLSFGPIQKEARSRAESLLRTRRKALYKEAGQGIDPEEFVKAFSRSPLRNDYYDVQMRAGADGYPKLVLNPRKTAGVREKLLTNKSSKFQKDLRELDPQKFYIRFLVTSDSYETYLIARSVAQSYGFAAGWQPQGPEWKFTGNMGGEIRLGPPRPEPPPGQKPAAPPPKRNDID